MNKKDEIKYFYVIPNYYGYGKTLEGARSACLRASGKKSPPEDFEPIVMYFDPEVFDNYGINDFGQISWIYKEGADQSIKPIRLPPIER